MTGAIQCPTSRVIGGFFGLELPYRLDCGFAKLWGLAEDSAAGFANARSAFAALVETLNPPNVWLPAYICPELAAAVPASKLAFYPLDDNLHPNIHALSTATGAGDIVLGVNYFGRAPSTSFIRFAEENPQLCFIEDCAQSIDTGLSPWGNWRLFSPRKVIGVPDGGLLLAIRPEISISVETIEAFDTAAFEPTLRRYEDEDEKQNVVWHAANQKREDSAEVSRARMSRFSRTVLRLLDPESIIRRRRDNFAVLHERLSYLAFLPEPTPRFVPFGFPIRVQRDQCDAVVTALAARGIFAPRHWRRLPSPAATFAREHQLSAQLITLPCDQRYSSSDMARVAREVERALA